MKVIIKENYEEMSAAAAGLISDEIKRNKKTTLGFATGSTPIGTYKILAQMCKKGEISFKGIKTVNLDEYVGLDKTSDQSYVTFMSQNLFDLVDIDKANTNLPNGCAKNLEKECQRYTSLLQANKQDIQLLGLGSNGHVGFNEPGTSFDSHTHIVDLTESTINDNSRLFEDKSQVPKQAITMGIADIMNAKMVILLASGKAKANAIYKMVKEPASESCPASVLQNHPNCVVIIDKEAAKNL